MTHGSLFSGIGGFDLAAKMAGWQNIFHCEIDEYKRQILNKNFKNVDSYGDISKFNATIYNGKIDIISGGFPCQDISIANTKKPKGIKGERSGLWKEYARIIREIRPKYIIFENNPALLYRGFETVLCDLYELGFYVEWRCFFASDFGYPHLRKRLYAIAYASSKRRSDIIKKGGVLQKVFPKKTPQKSPILFPIKLYDSKSSYENVRMDDGFSKELDKKLIHGYGNAIIPEIAYQIFMELNKYKF